ncbi:MAG TPA: CBS domain-containing protein [Microthrixaceae bacterium]|nr:CBS domain-containing protein [Microthrixaceae bacterium]
MRVADILRQKGDEVATIASAATLAEAAGVLSVRRIGALVVSDDGRSIDGILSERDIVRQLAEWGADALATPVREAMTADVRTCSRGDSVDALMAIMTEHRIRHLPVAEEGQLSGLVSIGDVVKRRVEQLEVETQQLTEYIQTGR